MSNKHAHEVDSAMIPSNTSLKEEATKDKIDKQRAEIYALHYKKEYLDEEELEEDKLEKLEKSHNQWVDTHEKVVVRKSDYEQEAKEREDKINAEREKIKEIQNRQRMRKLAAEAGTPIIDEEMEKKKEESHNQWVDTHEKVVVGKSDFQQKDKEREDKINAEREKIKEIKMKQRMKRLAAEAGTPIIDEETEKKKKKSHNQWVDTHEDKSTANRGIDLKQKKQEEKIAKKRAEIKALKAGKSKSKATTFGNMHEKKSTAKHGINLKQKQQEEKIAKRREEIRRIKEKRRKEKLEHDTEDEEPAKISKRRSTLHVDPHEKKSGAKRGINLKQKQQEEKIKKQREEIRKIKEKRKKKKTFELMDEETPKVSKRRSTLHVDPHEKKSGAKRGINLKQKKQEELIAKKRAEIKALKAGKSKAKTTTFGNAHEKKAKDNSKIRRKQQEMEDEKLRQKRAEIKAQKARRKMEKEQGLKASKRTVFGNAHEQ